MSRTKSNLTKVLLFIALAALTALVAWFVWDTASQNTVKAPDKSSSETNPFEPMLVSEPIADDLSHPWDIGELPTGEIIFTERDGDVSIIKDGEVNELEDIDDVYTNGEGGLMGLAVDSDFENNRYLYFCFNSDRDGVLDVRVARFTYDGDDDLENRTDIVTGIPSNTSGRHSGCQVESAKDGTLWITTGDAANASNPQDPKSLGGKVLRVDGDGNGVEGNLRDEFDPRIFSYGHRNIQGLYLFDEPVNGVYGYLAEHGSDIEDEVNKLISGNFGWAPKEPYNETNVPMTDKERFPDAVEAVWNSGSSTIAVSGLTRLSGPTWGDYEDNLVIGVLKDQHLLFLSLKDGKVDSEKKLFVREYGRIRSVFQRKNGTLLVSTDNGNDDKIIKITSERQ